MRALSVFAFDVRLLWRHGFFWVYILICALYWTLLQFIPDKFQEKTVLLLTYSDPSAIGLILAGGIVLLEKDQGIHEPLFASPLRVREYLLSKSASISFLSLLAAWTIHLSSVGVPQSPIGFSIGVVLSSSFMTLLSVSAVTKCRSINGFLLLSQAYALPFSVPVLGYFNIWNTSLYTLLPTQGTILLLQSAFKGLSIVEWIYAIVILVVWNYFAYVWAKRSYERHVLGMIGVTK